MKLDIVGIGHIINETIVFPDKKTKSVLGSPPAYSMVCAARLGAKVGIVTKIGSDYPVRLLKPFTDSGVWTKGIVYEGDNSTTNELVYKKDGSKVIRYIKKAPLIRFGDIPEGYHDTRLFYICPMDFEVPIETVEKLRTLGRIMAVDLGGFGGAHTAVMTFPQMKKDLQGTKRLIGNFDIVKVSDEDCRRLTGNNSVNETKLALKFIDWGSKIIVITQGSQGALIITGKDKCKIPSFIGKPKDATGGGDTYMAGFLVRYLETNDIYEAGLFGAVTALLVIEKTGGVKVERMPTKEKVEVRLNKGRKQLGICPPIPTPQRH